MRIRRRRAAALVAPWLAPALVRSLSATWRVEELHRERFDSAEPADPATPRPHGRIATLWHGRMLLAMRQHRGAGYRVLVSPSDDGALVLGLLRRFGYGVIRGSSNRRSARALREMVDALEHGHTIIVTPDGPRGPRHDMNPGPVWMARATGFALVPAGLVCDRAWRLKSWDRFTIPKPRARVVIAFGEPLRVPADTPDAELEALSHELKRRMLSAEEEGFRHLGVERDW